MTTSTRGMVAVLFGLCLCAVVGFDSAFCGQCSSWSFSSVLVLSNEPYIYQRTTLKK